ncbi:MAG: Guanylate kinase [Alphaproteobacteria bacterium MarineAlpha9_Bin4]|nr:guanylate kinase [Pelagibacterales bacterium]PPR25677.1 MAG: Guanylate kinase [Alphaproteobacteria bacterium MarineAlpha9_Bin4]|tara:strand:- start:2897 stop:3529 length:633 start_codon:yes stop_codon:yes gene_type:complete
MSNRKIKRLGIMLVISSPSGAGKTTLARRLLQEDNEIKLSVSVTTRKPRKIEENNKDYIFIDEVKFKSMVENNELLEFAHVFGNNYGTPRKPVEKRIKNGKDVLFDIDWQGTQALREMEPKHLVSVFILPPSTEELEKRLQSRGQDTLEEVSKRMAEANSEITHWAEYDYIIINNDIEKTLEKLKAILISERLRRVRQVGLIDFVRKVLN